MIASESSRGCVVSGGHLSLDPGMQACSQGQHVVPVPRDFADDEESGEEVVKEQVWGRHRCGPGDGLDAFESLAVEHWRELISELARGEWGLG